MMTLREIKINASAISKFTRRVISTAYWVIYVITSAINIANFYHTDPISTRDSNISLRAEGQWAGVRLALLLLRTSARRKK